MPTSRTHGPPATHDDIIARIEDVNMRMTAGALWRDSVEAGLIDIKESLVALGVGQAAIRSDIEPVLTDIAIIKDVIGASKAIQTGVRFLKWMGAIAAAVAAIMVAVKVSAGAIWRALG